jgi:D,D-heptose 1,7-bisphosphate phosphatase
MRDIEVFILAGGFGSRLSKVVNNVPKPMALIAGKPFLEYLICLLKQQGFEKFCLLVGYKHESIIHYFKDGQQFDVEIRYQIEDQPLGTGGALKKAFSSSIFEWNLVINGDTFFNINYYDFINFSKGKNIIALKYSEDIKRYGSVEIDSNYKVTQFVEKKQLMQKIDAYINAGVYFFKNDIFKKIDQDVFSLENEFLQKRECIDLYGLPTSGFFIDIGIPESYADAQISIPPQLVIKRKPCLFLDRDGVLIDYIPYLSSTHDVRIKPDILTIIRYFQKKNYLVGVISNQAGIAKGKISQQQHQTIQQHIEDLLQKENIILDFYDYCFYHEESILEEYKKISLARKPKPGMFLRCADKYHIEINQSIMIGDNITDQIELPFLKSFLIESKDFDLEKAISPPFENLKKLASFFTSSEQQL